MEDIIRKYDELYDEMVSSKDPRRMMAFGDAEKWVFYMLAQKHPEIAERWVSKLEAGKWNNFLSRHEAEEVTSKLVNQDGTHGPHWDYETFKAEVESLGGMMTNEPLYNCWALWATANMFWSDHARSASEFVPIDMMPKYFFNVAVEKLTDIDRPKFVRDYFHV